MSDSLQVVVDSAAAKEDNWIMHHIQDANYFELPGHIKIPLPHIELFGIDLSITKHVLIMLIVAVLLLILFTRIAKSYKKSLVPSGITNFFEIFIIFVRDDIAKDNIGKGYERFVPYLLTTFFFILFGNFFGLIPLSATFTSNIAVTSVLAVIAFLVIQGGGMAKNGLVGYFVGLVPHGLPVWLVPLIFVLELIGLLTKPFALAIRLFANMTAGHIVIYALIGLMFVLGTLLVSPVSIGMALFINVLEVLIALLQAYIFTMLTAVFIGMAVHQDH